jgi:membrane-associated phospholipid phosphatase
MQELQAFDVAVFRWINQSGSNSFCDAVMPFFAWNPFFVPAVMLAALGLLWKGGRRGSVCLFLLALAILVTDGVVCHTLKEAIHRARPFAALENVRLLVGQGGSGSMPSSHAANWFAATLVLFVYYRKSLAFMLPLAVIVSFSRIYDGVHYPSDVLAGIVLGAGSAAAVVWSVDRLWRGLGPAWLPALWQRCPSLMRVDEPVPDGDRHAEDPDAGRLSMNRPGFGVPPLGGPEAPEPAEAGTPNGLWPVSRSARNNGLPTALPEAQWLRLGYLAIALVLAIRLLYLAGDKIELSQDEAYQWIWSKHLALSYYSKPPMIACLQFLSTHLWGDTAFGIRFLSPVIGAIASLIWLRFLAKETRARAGVLLVLVTTTTPLLAVGSILMTIDPPTVLFWSAAMVTGWRAVQSGSTRHWLWTGLWMGMGFLTKYSTPLQLMCWAVFFLLWKPARAQLRQPGPYLALAVVLGCTIPVLIWNWQHGWITVTHLASRGGLDSPWQFTGRFFAEFTGAQLGLLNPVCFLAMLGAVAGFWRHYRKSPFHLYLFSMGAPVFLFYWAYTLRARVQPNWVAPAILPLFALMILYWEARWLAGDRSVTRWLKLGLGLGAVLVVCLHDTNLIGKAFGRPLPPRLDPLRRVRAWEETARVVGNARQALLVEGKPVFIIGDHYSLTSLITFYLPEAKAGVPDHPLVYYLSTDQPANQFYFWPGYSGRKGENAIFMRQVESPDATEGPPARLQQTFESVRDLGVRPISYRGRILRQIQLFECRHLR